MQLNEGLEKLGEKEVLNENEWEGRVFAHSAVENVRLPSTLKRIEGEMFKHCHHLKRIEIPNGVEYIGKCCFDGSDIEEITLPGTLKGLGLGVFIFCNDIREIWVEEGCTIDLGE